MANTRRVGLVIIIAATAVVWFFMAPPAKEVTSANLTTKDYATMVQQALSDFHTNEASADSAPKQQVVNGWVARDLLTVISLENVDLLNGVGALGDQTQAASAIAARDDRTPALLALAVAAICWYGITAPSHQDRTRPESPSNLDSTNRRETT